MTDPMERTGPDVKHEEQQKGVDDPIESRTGVRSEHQEPVALGRKIRVEGRLGDPAACTMSSIRAPP